MEEKPHTRLYVEDDLAGGATVALGRGRAHFLAHVLRLGVGATVALFNGRDGEWRAHIESLGKGGVTLVAGERTRTQTAEPDLWLVFAPLKKTPLDFLVQKATELGASALMPAITRRTVVSRVKRDRMATNALEAAEQCGRLTVPRVDDAMALSRILECWPVRRHVMLCAESGAAEPIGEFLARATPGGPWAIITGPEGGFEETELQALRKHPFVSAVGLGPRLLRAETAALVALACWQAALGDGRSRPPERR